MDHVSNVMIAILVIEIVVSIICVGLIIYFQKQFNNISHLIMIQKRNPEILKHLGIFITCWFVYGFPIMALDYVLRTLDHEEIVKEILFRLNYMMTPPLTFGIFMTTAWRFWHIYFDLKYSSSQKNSDWKYHLDPELVQHNFWLTHKKTFGSYKWTKQFVIVWYIVSVSIICGIYQIIFCFGWNYLWIAHSVSCCLHSVATGSAVILALKVPQYNDNFFVKKEIKMITMQFLIVSGVALIAAIIGVFLSFTMIIISIVCSLLFLDIFLVSFWWIPQKILLEELRLKKLRAAKKSGEDSSIQSNSNTNTVASNAENANNNKKKHNLKHIVGRLSGKMSNPQRRTYKLHDVLSYERTFKLFMQHLAKEFSTECLLCFVEIMQYKFLMVQRFNVIDPNAITSELNFDDIDKYPLHETVPLSTINREGFKNDISEYSAHDSSCIMMEAKKICVQFYKKYIENGSELEVNISYEKRARLKNLMGNEEFFMSFNINPDELLCIYDDTAAAMFRLMGGSFSRFALLPVFNTVKQAIDNM